MFDKKKIKELILSTLVADAYSLGAHWIYDEKQLEKLEINWEELNDAQALWHKEKKAGDFTHFGDQTLWLYQYLLDHNCFDEENYINFWFAKMQTYNGYIDSATRQTLENIENKKSPTGSSSTDLSIIGRIAPLLLVSKSKEQFLNNVTKFVSCTHNSTEALSAADFFAKLVLDVLEGKDIEEAILSLKDEFDSKIQGYVNSGISSKSEETFTAIRDFGPACDIEGGFQGVIHLLCKYDNLTQMLIQNSKAGGDNSARAMIATLVFMAKPDNSLSLIPNSWLKIKASII